MRWSTMNAAAAICTSSVFLTLLIGSVHGKALFSLRIDSLTDTQKANKPENCYERTSVTSRKPCAKSLQVSVHGGTTLPLPTLNNTNGTVVSLSPLPTEASITIDGALPASFKLVADLYQSTASHRNEHLARFVFFPANVSLSDQWLTFESSEPTNWSLPTARTLRLASRYRIRCKSAFYGPTCQVYCEPRDDFGGHYTCMPNGHRLCLPGWSGPDTYCQEPICPGCHEKGGKCTSPGICQCQVGWHGANCSECQRYAGCHQGYCVEPNECRCNTGWTGRFCNHELDVCSRLPCDNGATCIDNPDAEDSQRYQCRCARGFTGPRCEILLTSARPTTSSWSTSSRRSETQKQTVKQTETASVCSGPSCGLDTSQRNACSPSPCRNGATCVLSTLSDLAATNETFTCVCLPGYTGTRCETPDSKAHLCRARNCFDPQRCQVRLGELGLPQCVCLGDYTGPACNLISCTRRPCANAGYCDTYSGLCHCKVGFNGSHCEIEANHCLPNPCVHGVCDQIVGSQFCRCDSGWAGELCNINLFDSLADRSLVVANVHDQLPLISPTLFWSVISICAVLIAVLLVVAKVLISGIKKRQNATSGGSPPLCIVSPNDDSLVHASIDCQRRLHAHLIRHQPVNNLGTTTVTNISKRDQSPPPCAKKLSADDEDETDELCRTKLLDLGASCSANSAPLFDHSSCKIGTNNLFNPNVNTEKVLPSKTILSFTCKAELQNHANASRSRLSSEPLMVRSGSPPHWNAPRQSSPTHSFPTWSNAGSRTSSVSSPRRNAHIVSVPRQQTAPESSAYRASGNSLLH